MNPFSDVEHPWSWMHREEIGCSSCPAQLNPFDIFFTHPVMKTLQCEKCSEFYSNGLFTTDAEGYYEHCRWCADGGTLYGCDKCVESFCKQVNRNNSKNFYQKIKENLEYYFEKDYLVCSTESWASWCYRMRSFRKMGVLHL